MRLEKGKAAIYDQAFLRFIQEELRKEAQALDATLVTLRMEAGALIVTEQRPTETRAKVERLAWTPATTPKPVRLYMNDIGEGQR
jgi:hypothetical protein